MNLREQAVLLEKKFQVPDPDLRIDGEKLKGLSPREEKRALEQLRRLEELKRAAPLWFYNPFRNWKQYAFHQFKTKWKVFLGGNQSGKTTALINDCLIQAQDLESLPPWLQPFKKFHPPFRCRIGGQGREEIEDFIFEKLMDWISPEQLVGGSWKTAYDGQTHMLLFKNGSYINFKTYTQERAQWGGSTLDRVALDEEPPEDKWKESQVRTMARHGDICCAMTPVSGITHMFDYLEGPIDQADKQDGVVESEVRDKDGSFVAKIGLCLVDMDENWTLSTEQKATALHGRSEQERTAIKEGRFIALHGLVWNDFDDTNIIEAPDEPELPENVNVFVGIDPGWDEKGGAAVVWTYLTPDNRLVAFHEFLWPSSTIARITNEIHRVNAAFNIRPTWYVIDAAARNVQSQTGRSDQQVFADHGIVAIAAQRDVPNGIVMVRERLQNGSLLVWDSCEGLIKEMRRYRWKNPPATGEDGTPRPYKKDDHRCDALRYVVQARPYVPDVPIQDGLTDQQRALKKHRESFSAPRRSVV